MSPLVGEVKSAIIVGRLSLKATCRRASMFFLLAITFLSGSVYSSEAASAPVALRTSDASAKLTIGGELYTDYIGRLRSGSDVNGDRFGGSWRLHNSNLRFDFDLADTLNVRIKLDLSENYYGRGNHFMEEAMVIWNGVCGEALGLFFGKGEAPYGQDRTLGIIQSYNHTEGSESSEGPVILNAPVYFDKSSNKSIIYHPGEIDKVVMAGITLAWEDILRFEFACFQPDDIDPRLVGSETLATIGDTPFSSFAGRLWWNTPVDGLVAEISGVRKHIRRRGDAGVFGAGAVEDEYAISVGADWLVSDELELFAEYQHGFNWGFRDGYNTDTVSIGGLYRLTDKINAGAMAEWLHIDDNGEVHNFNKFVLHGQYEFDSGVYVIAEYGLELYNWDCGMTSMFALRTGMSF